jgi:hypothetical protein
MAPLFYGQIQRYKPYLIEETCPQPEFIVFADKEIFVKKTYPLEYFFVDAGR